MKKFLAILRVSGITGLRAFAILIGIGVLSCTAYIGISLISVGVATGVVLLTVFGVIALVISLAEALYLLTIVRSAGWSGAPPDGFPAT